MNNMPLETKGIQIIGEIRPSYEEILTPDADLLDRRVEITGPVDRKMIINTLNSGANLCFHG
jgi:malate synthase